MSCVRYDRLPTLINRIRIHLSNRKCLQKQRRNRAISPSLYTLLCNKRRLLRLKNSNLSGICCGVQRKLGPSDNGPCSMLSSATRTFVGCA